MTRLNTCPQCGHYVHAHDEGGCECATWDRETKRMLPCSCTLTREELKDYEYERFIRDE